MVSFYLPYDFNFGNQVAPQPSDSQISIQRMPAIAVAVKSFSGFSTNETNVISNAVSLVESLQRDNIKFDAENYYSAGYDSPQTVSNRYNEVWIKVSI